MKIEINKIESALVLQQEFTQKLKSELAELPYQINLLDQNWPNENAHSRIFIRLLQYQENETYIFLNSFLKLLGEPFGSLSFSRPEFSAEADRIDARIRDQDMSKTLIIENKVHYAVDQKRQIERYIEVEKAAGFATETIYVLYLTRSGGSPTEYSLSKQQKGSLESKGNYKEISFQHEIMDWLEKLPSTISEQEGEKTELLKSAILQYSNHLKGLFYQREGENKVSRNIKNHLQEKLSITDGQSTSQKVKALSQALFETDTLRNQLHEMQREYALDTIQNFKEKLTVSIEKEINLPCNNALDKGVFGESNSYIAFSLSSWPSNVFIGIGFEKDLERFYYGLADLDHQISESERDTFRKELPEPMHHSPNWPYYQYLKFQELADLIAEIESGALAKKIQESVSGLFPKAKAIIESTKK